MSDSGSIYIGDDANVYGPVIVRNHGTVTTNYHITHKHERTPLPTIDLATAQAHLASMPLDTVPAPASPPTPHLLPLHPNPQFIGRDAELKVLAADLKAGRTVVVTTGIGGVGKTQLAVEFAHRYGQYFQGGVFWLSFADPAGVDAVISECGGMGCMQLYAAVDDLTRAEQVAKVYAAWEQELPRLLIFDNCDDLPGRTAEQDLVARLPRGGGCRVLVTSRRGQWSRGLSIMAHHLDTLPRAESITLLRSIIGTTPLAPDSQSPTPDPLAAIAEALGDLPLALSLAGSYLALYHEDTFGQPAIYLANLQKQMLSHRSLQGKGADLSLTDHKLNVYATFDLSYQRLNAAGPTDALAIAALARAACLAPGEPFPRDLLLATLGEETDDEEVAVQRADALQRLVALGLLERAVGDALRMHRLIAAYVFDLVPSDGAPEALEHALIDMVYRLNEDGFPKAMALLLAHLRYVLTRAEKAQREDIRFATLLMQMGYYLNISGDYPGALSLYQRAIAMNERMLGPTHPQTLISLNNLAALHRATGNYTAALTLYQRALSISEQTLDPAHPQIVISLNNLAALYRAIGDYTAAKPLYQRALNMSEQALGPDHPQTAISLNNLAALYQATGDYTAAKPLYQRALNMSEQALGPDHPQTAISLNNLAALYQATGDYTAALPLYQRALAINEQALGPDHPRTVDCLNNLAALYQTMGDYTAALPLYERILEINQLTLDPTHPKIAVSISNLAINVFWQGQYLRAQGLMHWALHILETSVGPEHPDTLAARRALAFVEQRLADPLVAFTPIVAAIAAVAAGDEAQRADTEDTLNALEHQGWHLHEAVQRLWAGERNIQRLTTSLDDPDAELIRRVFALLPPSS